MNIKKSITLLAGMTAIMAFAGIAQAETRFAVQDPTGQTDKMVVTDTGNIGIGTSTPGMAITIDKPGTTGETSMMFRNNGGLPYSQYNSPSFYFMKNNDISVNNGLVANGDRMGSISFGSMVNSAIKLGANISAYTSASWSTTSFPGYLSFSTTGPANSSPQERMRIDQNGNIGVGTNAPSQKLEVNGGVRLNTTTTKPTCSSSLRGTLWFTQGGTGVADTLEVCAKDASANYAWKALF